MIMKTRGRPKKQETRDGYFNARTTKKQRDMIEEIRLNTEQSKFEVF